MQNWSRRFITNGFGIVQQQCKRNLSSAATSQQYDISKFDMSKNFRQTDTDGYVRTTPYEDINVPNVTLSQFAWQNYLKWQNRVAAVCAITGRGYTYAQMRDACAFLAVRLQTKFGLKREDVVAVCLPNLPEFPIASFGILEAGLIITTINPIYTADEIAKQLINSNTKLIIGTVTGFPVYQEAIRKTGQPIKIVCIKTSKDQSLPSGAIDFFELINPNGVSLSDLKTYDIDPNDTAFLPYSSGTTGLPKGVMLTHRNIITNCRQIQINLPYEQMIYDTTETYQDVCPSVLPFFHIYGFTVTLAAKIETGIKIVTLPTFQPDSFLRSLIEHKGTVLHLVPPIILFLAAHKSVASAHLESVRRIVVGAAPIGLLDAERMLKKAPQVSFVQGYGLTETSPGICLNYIGNRTYASVGAPLPETEVKVVGLNDPNNIGLGPNESGEILCRGPQIMKGYWNNEQATAEVMTEGNWLRTGDLGHYDERGFFYITDRLKELIKVKGFQVAPAELEEILRDHPQVQEAAVIGIDHDKHGEVPRAFIVKVPGSDVSEQALLDYVAEKVAPFKRIRGGVRFLDNIPKNQSGKIVRRELKLNYS